MRPPTRWARVVVVAVVAALAPGVAHADAAAPTDYRTVVESIEPMVDGLDVTIEGGDAFVRLRAPAGSEVIVLGYLDEPYLRFVSDGTVAQNLRSPATYENADRFGVTELPDDVDAVAEPEWDVVSSGGVWAWHDHRSHWMGSQPPLGLEPGDSLPPQVIPLEVDGRPVEITVVTSLVGSPSWLGPALGALIGLQFALLALWLGHAVSTLVASLTSLAALAVGLGQFWSLPSETGPLHTWWLMPAIALLCAVSTIVLYGRSRLIEFGLVAIAAVQLLIWAVQRRSVLTSAVLPTNLPYWFDRMITAATLVAATLLLVGAIRSVVIDARPATAERT